MAYTQVATISTDEHHTLQEFRASVGAPWPFLSDPGRTIQQDLDIAEYTDPDRERCRGQQDHQPQDAGRGIGEGHGAPV